MLRYCLTALAALSLTGCVSSTPAMRSSARPATTAERTEITNSVRVALKDPYSIREAALTSVFTFPNGSEGICVRGNAKNSFGGYAGVTTALLYLRNGRVVMSNMDAFAQSTCADFAFQPFPELEQLKAL